MMIHIVQTMNWWCGYVNWIMVMDHVKWCIDGTLTMLVEALGKHACSYIMMFCIVKTMNWWCGYVNWIMVMDHLKWCIDGTLTMLVEALGKHGWSWIHNRDSSTCTLGILSFSEVPSQDDIVKKALKQGVGWNCMSHPRSVRNSLNNSK